MTTKLLELKRLNAAYIAALEYDHCPSSNQLEQVMSLFETGVDREDLTTALDENEGSRPDEIASQMSELIKTIEP
jgi:hypothetical protein